MMQMLKYFACIIVKSNLDSFDYKIEFQVCNDELKIGITRNEFDFGDEEERILKEAEIPEEEWKYFHGVVKTLSFFFPEIGEKENVIGNYRGILYFNKITATSQDTAMWIVKRTVVEYNGDIDLSENKILDNGFKIVIRLGGM